MKEDFFKPPTISSSCQKDLSTPLNAASSFLLPIFTETVKHTNENLRAHEEKAITEDDLIVYVLYRLAVICLGEQAGRMAEQVKTVRDKLFIRLGVKADWPGRNRLCKIPQFIRTFPGSGDNARDKIEPLFKLFNETSKDTIQGSHGWSLDEASPKFFGSARNRCPTDRIPVREGVKPVNFALCSVRYSEKLLLQKKCKTKGMKPLSMKDITALLDVIVTEPSTPVCTDRGYTQLDLLSECTKRSLPYVGTVRPDWLRGNRPIFPLGQTTDFQQQMYPFKIKGSDVYLTCYYDQEGKPPACFLSNFHTGELAHNLTKRPQISAIYKRLMYGVDQYDLKGSFMAQKPTVRMFEHIVRYLLVNARTAYCIRNGHDMSKYNMTHFYHDLLRERFKTVELLSTVSILSKVNFIEKKKCSWRGCSKQTSIPCTNSRCNKVGCDPLHSHLVCFECARKPFDRLTVSKSKIKTKTTVRCGVVTHCKNRTTIICCVVGCDTAACGQHRSKLCSDCCSYSKQFNFSLPLPNLYSKNFHAVKN